MHKTELDVIEHKAHLWSVVRDMLIEADCPIEDGCHVPTVVGNWLAGVTAMRTFSAARGMRGFDANEVVRQLENAAHAGDSSLHEVAAIVIRRLLANHVCHIGGKPIAVDGKSGQASAA